MWLYTCVCLRIIVLVILEKYSYFSIPIDLSHPKIPSPSVCFTNKHLVSLLVLTDAIHCFSLRSSSGVPCSVLTRPPYTRTPMQFS